MPSGKARFLDVYFHVGGRLEEERSCAGVQHLVGDVRLAELDFGMSCFFSGVSFSLSSLPMSYQIGCARLLPFCRHTGYPLALRIPVRSCFWGSGSGSGGK